MSKLIPPTEAGHEFPTPRNKEPKGATWRIEEVDMQTGLFTGASPLRKLLMGKGYDGCIYRASRIITSARQEPFSSLFIRSASSHTFDYLVE